MNDPINESRPTARSVLPMILKAICTDHAQLAFIAPGIALFRPTRISTSDWLVARYLNEAFSDGNGATVEYIADASTVMIASNFVPEGKSESEGGQLEARAEEDLEDGEGEGEGERGPQGAVQGDGCRC